MLLAISILLLGVTLPILATRYFVQRLQANLDLLNDYLSNIGKGNSSLMPQTFEFQEFDAISETLRQVTRVHGETERRWKRAENELISTNTDLIDQASELKRGHKFALSMMEDAENAREELEVTNNRLNEMIEQAKQAKCEADNGNRAKSDFLATMSHEIRTPLNGIIGFVEMLDDTKLSVEQDDILNRIKSSSEVLMSLINNVLDFSKVESGHLNLESRGFSILPVIRDLKSMFSTQAKEKGLSLKITMDNDVLRKLTGDETRFRQILLNLLSNAIKFTQSGEVTLHLSKHNLDTESNSVELEFKVRDTGIGMSSEEIGRLFLPFSQGDSSTTRKYGGTGLGLAICKNLSEAMGGKVWVTSQPGEGSSFIGRVRFDLDTMADNQAPLSGTEKHNVIPSESINKKVESDKLADSLALKIAVAEDNEANQQVILMMLRRLGWESEFAGNGQELLDLVRDKDFDLIFMDVQMPLMDGLEATRRLRAGEAGEEVKDVKIIALTANALSGDETRCLESGMDAFMSKPLKLNTLKQTIQTLYEL
jgi:signal transduction histidine kinase/ActR/RegA family two-component response regulator